MLAVVHSVVWLVLVPGSLRDPGYVSGRPLGRVATLKVDLRHRLRLTVQPHTISTVENQYNV